MNHWLKLIALASILLAGGYSQALYLSGHSDREVVMADRQPQAQAPGRLDTGERESWVRGELSTDGFLSDFLSERTDRNLDSAHGDKRRNYPFVNADGACIWQSRQKGRETFEKAMKELRTGDESHRIFGELRSTHDAGNSRDVSTAADLPFSMIPAGIAHKWLRALKNLEDEDFGGTRAETWRMLYFHIP